MTTPVRQPLARAAELLGYQEDVVASLEVIGTEADARTAALADEIDPTALLVERDAIVHRVGAVTAGVNTETYWAWWSQLVRRLNSETLRVIPDAQARGRLLNVYPFSLGA